MTIQPIVDVAQSLIDHHRENSAMVDEGNLETRLWHMLMDLRYFARLQGIDLDALYRDVEKQYPIIYPEGER